MTHQEKLELEKLRLEIKKLSMQNCLNESNNKLLNEKNKILSQLVNDFNDDNYKKKYEATSSQLKTMIDVDKERLAEINELKKKVCFLEKQLAISSVKINKDSSNSSKPSSTNGFKKVITNRRVKSDKKQGGQLGHIGDGLTLDKVDKLLQSENVEVQVIEVDKNNQNCDKVPKIRRVIDIKVITHITEYRYFPNIDGKYNIPREHSSIAQYGAGLKSLCIDLMIGSNNSTDSVVRLVNSITDGKIKLSKGSLINWQRKSSDILFPELVNIQKNLINSYYINHDESQIKINTQGYNVMCASNKEYTRLWCVKNKSRVALDEIGFLKHYEGIIVKDGTNLYNGFGSRLSQCISHILRYIKGIYDNVNHSGAKKMSEFLSKTIKKREAYILNEEYTFDQDEYLKYISEYEKILKSWKKEWMNSKEEENPVYDEERKLLTRFEEDKKEILYFMKDFKIPATNNQAESDLRTVKIKQKIGKFRSENGGKYYAEIRSCINTYKKHGKSFFTIMKSAFDNNLIIV